jgi:hypothetical protein
MGEKPPQEWEQRVAGLSAQEAGACVSELHAALSTHDPPELRLIQLLEKLCDWGLIADGPRTSGPTN